ncbi:MAG: hypothetical protein Tsb0034_31650 [Ekhidna sp.]
MTTSLRLYKFIPALPLIIPVVCVLVTRSALFANHTSDLSMAITFDLLISTPLIYFLIIRKRAISNLTLVPVFVLGVITATLILPKAEQHYLSLVKTWFLPLLEIGILSYVIITIRKAFKAFDKSKSPDFFTAAKEASASILPRPLVLPFATELSVFYYGLFQWKKATVYKNQFTYHKETSTQMLLIVFAFIVLIEAGVVHILLQSWSMLAAWILTGLSLYGGFQLLGISKSLSRRPIQIDDTLIVKYGIMNEASIDFENIASIELTKKEVAYDKATRALSPFKEMEGHNVLLTLKDEGTLTGFYGIKKRFSRLTLQLDEPQRFKEVLEEKISASQ